MGRSRNIERKILTFLHKKKTQMYLPEIHATVIRNGLYHLNSIQSHFISVCGSVNKMGYAEKVFLCAGYPDIYVFNAMIKGYSHSGPVAQSLAIYSVMKKRGVYGDIYTYAPLLKACSSMDLRIGRSVHKDAFVIGFEQSQSVRVGILELYSCNGALDDARKLFDEMPHREAIFWNLMINGYCRNGQVDAGLELFRQMTNRSVVSWNIAISGLLESGKEREALHLFKEMQAEGFQPDEATLVTLLPVCGRLDSVEVGKIIHCYAESSGLLREFASVGNALMQFYNKCGLVNTALNVFDKMSKKTAITWNTIISCVAYHGKDELGIELFERMIEEGFEPNESTFVGVLTCCSHGGMVDRGKEFFNLMRIKYEMEPSIEHYGCMVDLLGREGHLEECYELITSMPNRANCKIWGSLLSACRNGGNLEMAILCLNELIKLEPWNSGNYVLLSNVYAQDKKWDEVEKLRLLMKEKGILKVQGQSSLS